MSPCLFCQIANGELSPEIVYETDEVLAFRDINPQAPVHVLVIPRVHIPTINDLDEAHAILVGKLYLAAREVAQRTGLTQPGYRTIMNCNADGGQTVFHLHLHVLGGRRMSWPPG